MTDDGRVWCFCVELAKYLNISLWELYSSKGVYLYLHLTVLNLCAKFLCSLDFLQVGRQSVQEALHDDTPNLQSRSRQ